jgi:hypothetical protein
MTENRRDFSRRLLRCESPSEALRQKYEKEIRAMFEKQLGTGGRILWWFWTVFCLAQAIMFTRIAVWSYGDLPISGTIGFVGGTVFALAFGSICAQIAWTGRLKLKTQPPAMVGIMWCFVVMMMTLFMVTAPDTIVGLRMILSGLVFFVMGGVFLLASRTEQAELRTKEKLLEIELRLAELADGLRGGSERAER